MRFSVLDSFRGVAAIVVALYHVEIIGEIYAGHSRGVAFISNGYLFVDFFFVLSGFVIAHTYQSRIRTVEDFTSFAIRRFGRVWPLHMAVLLAFVGLELVKLAARSRGVATDSEPFSGSFTVPSIFTGIVLLQSFGLQSGLTWNAPAWSIGVEFYTYLVFGLLAMARRGSIAAMAAAVAVFGAAVVAAFAHDNMRTTFDYGFFRCLYGFFTGVLVYGVYHAGRQRPLKLRISPAALELPAAVAVVLFVSAAGAGRASLLSPLVFGIVVYIFAWEQGPVSRLLLAGPFRIAGTLSYSIYMNQALLLIAMARIIRVAQSHAGAEHHVQAMVEGRIVPLLWFGSAWSSDALVALYLALLLGMSVITYRLVENPGRAFFNRIALRAGRRVKGAAADQPPALTARQP